MRGVLITVLIGLYAWLVGKPGVTLTAALLIAAGLQVGVLLMRKFVSPELHPQVLYLLELLADAATVVLFAIGVFGGILRQAYGY